MTENEIEPRARVLYEAIRKLVGGRHAWENLNQSDPHDVTLRSAALDLARAEMVINKGKGI